MRPPPSTSPGASWHTPATVADTLPDQPPPPTLRDPVRAASTRRRVAVACSILVAVVAVGAVAFYLFFWRYEAVARLHVPGNANLVVRLEAADVALFGPVRTHLLPLLIDHTERSGKKRGDRIGEATGINLATDVREVIVASVDATSWVLIAGGRIKRGRFVDGLARLSQEEGWGLRREGELLVGPGGVTLGQADDGTLVVGTDVSLVNAALPASDDARRLALPDQGAVTFAVTRQAWSGAAGLAAVTHASVLGRIARASGRMTLGDAPEVSLILEPAPGVEATALAGELEQVVNELRLVTLILPDVIGEKSALGAARITPGSSQVAITAPWPHDGLDRACQRLAQLLGGRGR